MTKAITKRDGDGLSGHELAELSALTGRVRDTLRRSAADIMAVGADLIRAKELLGHGNFGTWLDAEFSLSRRSAEQFMAAARRFGGRSEVISHLPAGAVVELSSPSVPDELVDRVLAGEVGASARAIRAERATERGDDRAYAVAGTFIDYLERFDGTDLDFAAGIAAHVLRRWREARHRRWFAGAMWMTAKMLERNQETKIPQLEMKRTTVRKLKEGGTQ